MIALPAGAQMHNDAAAGKAAAEWRAATPEAAAAELIRRFVARDSTAFADATSEPDSRQLMAWSRQFDWPLEVAGSGVVETNDTTSVLFVSGYPVVGNSGHETLLGQMFTGFREARLRNGGWVVVRKLPIDGDNRILSRAIGVELKPGAGLHATDTMDVEIAGGRGLWLHANRRLAIREAKVGATVIETRQYGGLVHVKLRDGAHRLVLVYALDVARDSSTNGNFSHFGPEYGHVRSQHSWHPTLDGSGGRDVVPFRITVRAPSDVHVVTSIPQTSEVRDGVRHVMGRSARPTSSLSLFYDRAWRPSPVRMGSVTAELFIGDGFETEMTELESALQRVHSELSARFGEPSSGYQAIVQVRGASSYGWHFRSNDVIGSGTRGGALSKGEPAPAHFIGHEMAHSWTNPAGPARLFLIEGWARFAESVLIRAEYGADAERIFWERQRKAYLAGGHEGQNSLAADEFNTGISYEKGAWVMRMLRDFTGTSAFEAGMRTFIAQPPGTQSVATFTSIISQASGRDVGSFLRPWLEETRIPTVRVQVTGDSVVVTQEGPLYVLPLELEVETDAGTDRRTVLLQDRSVTVRMTGRSIRRVTVDPDSRLLLHLPEES